MIQAGAFRARKAPFDVPLQNLHPQRRGAALGLCYAWDAKGDA